MPYILMGCTIGLVAFLIIRMIKSRQTPSSKYTPHDDNELNRPSPADPKKQNTEFVSHEQKPGEKNKPK